MFKKRKKIYSPTNLITQWSTKSLNAEQFRTIRTNIQFTSVGREIHSLVVTSSEAGEGKSTISANIAVVFAQQGKKVLFVDADLRKPTIHYTYDVPNVIGLTNVLTQSIEVNDAILKTNIDNLFVLTSGPIAPNPAELLGSPFMMTFIQDCKRDFDIVIFDTPPLLTVTDAQILANMCDGSVLVVSSSRSNIDKTLKAKEILQSSASTLLGAVLNNKKKKEEHRSYYYNNV